MSLILDTPPTTEEFFRDYWNKKPFVVRGMVPPEVISQLIDENYLAGLSMEEEVKSRLVRKGAKPKDWTCDHGPFSEKLLAELGDEDWSLLVQNIDQYHDGTAELLKLFNFSPRWLLDDIMASFSPKGGTVGAHTDSYHVFLVQGAGERRWRVASAAIDNEAYLEDIPLKILNSPFEGDDVTVTPGDVLYIPPKFAHEGISLKPSLTYSVGFLGPSLSEMLIEFGHYIEENHPENPRYVGQDLTEGAAQFQVTKGHIDGLKGFMSDVFDQDYFVKWLTHYFSSAEIPYAGDDHGDEPQNGAGSLETIDVQEILVGGHMLVKHPSVKVMIAPLMAPETYCISAGHYTFQLGFSDLFIVNTMLQEVPFSASIFADHTNILNDLLDRNILALAEV